MIVCALGYGYLSKFVFQRLCFLGIRGIGVTSKNINYSGFSNITFVNRDKTKEVLTYATHLLITAPPDDRGCPIFNEFSDQILKSNIKSIIYISSTGVYGNHKGVWVNEDSTLNARSPFDKIRIKSEKQWKTYCKKINLKVLRISGIYGPQRIIKFNKKKLEVPVKKNHYFSRIHILDAARLISKIILQNHYNDNDTWNLSDDSPSSREAFLLEAIKIKKIRHFSITSFEEYKNSLSDRSKKFWFNNKRVSNKKIKKFLEYKFIFPDYKSGIKNLKEYL